MGTVALFRPMFARPLPHHDQHPSEYGDPAEHGQDSFSLLPRVCIASRANHSDFFMEGVYTL
jgi:hypothetical protein